MLSVFMCDGKVFNAWIQNLKILVSFVEAENVERITASGHELQEIQNRVTGIPFCDLPIQVWYGDDARFIAGNLLTGKKEEIKIPDNVKTLLAEKGYKE